MDILQATMKVIYCVVLTAAVSLVSASEQFRSDYEYHAAAQGWFKFHKTPTDWELADLQCFYEGAVLASPLDKNIEHAMTSILGQYKDLELGVHTGISNRHSKAQYTSVEGVPLSDMPVDYKGLFNDEYSSVSYCIRMYLQGSLLAANCNDALPYICYKKKTRALKQTECGTVDKGYQLDKRTGHCYKFHNYATNWTLAYMRCAAEGGHLAIINSDKEADALKDLYSRQPPNTTRGAKFGHIAFLGFLDWYRKGTWRTIHGETLEDAGYAKWANTQPDNMLYNGYEQRCGGLFRTGGLDDIACEDFYVSICEKDPNSLRAKP